RADVMMRGQGGARAGAPDRPRGEARGAEPQAPEPATFGYIRTARRNLVYYHPAVIALGLAWYLVRRRAFEAEKERTTPRDGDPNLERWGLSVGVLTGLGLSVRNGLKGWFNIYRTDVHEDVWSDLLWQRLAPV